MNQRAIDTEKLVRIREQKMSRVELAAKVKYGEKQIYNLETGKAAVSSRLVDAVCLALEIDREDIEVREKPSRRKAS